MKTFIQNTKEIIEKMVSDKKTYEKESNMTDYPFQVVDYNRSEPLKDKSILSKRPFTQFSTSFEEDAKFFVPGEELEDAINTSIAVGDPLLITGEPGTGKTQAAYYTAYNLGIEPVIHFQVKSDSKARDLLYNFDTVMYFHDANFCKDKPLKKDDYVIKGNLWKAMESEDSSILLIDEIDKAPRDFPNDLLHELDKMEFTVAETKEPVSASKEKRPIVFITTNSERQLPDPFLRRCVYHHIEFNSDLLKRVVEKRKKEYSNLSSDFIETAMRHFLALRKKTLRKQPSTGEFLVWLRVLTLRIQNHPQQLEQDLSRLPYLSVLLKDHQDIKEL
ncbi:MAG: MoxR family ATPase [Desulfobacterales bacterium]|nr:MoxR family ATPase [Desulfobacterales bacterium]